MNYGKTSKHASYDERVKRLSPKSEKPMSLLKAFAVGGGICLLGQLIRDAGLVLELEEDAAALLSTFSLVFLSALLTGLGVYDKLGRFAGAGSIVPITGFANSMVSPAMEFKREGYITGVGAKMFVIAGPVLVYGISSSVLVGLIYFFLRIAFKG
ncbi:MAG: stage V sporulation protein AC [Christensenellaceae bacterium]|jgi:stage V sporulation protein AC|nr:stage V sporulation protein AC [Christensenellaceae bacterium]